LGGGIDLSIKRDGGRESNTTNKNKLIARENCGMEREIETVYSF